MGEDRNRLEAGVSLLFYCCVSLGVVFFNKWLFERTEFPVFVSWVQQLVGVVLFCGLSLVGKVSGHPTLASLPRRPPSFSVVFRLVPLAFCFVAMVASANQCLKIAPVSTYQVTRSLTLIFTVLGTVLLLQQRISCGVLGACTCVLAGFMCVSSDTHRLQSLGAILGATSSVFQALYQVLIKRCLPLVEDDHIKILYCNTALASIIFPVFVILAGELPAVYVGGLALVYDFPDSVRFLPPMIFSGILAVLLNFASFWCVKVTSPLTFNIAGIGKAAVQAMGGLAILGDPFGPRTIIGILLKLTGSSAYTVIRYNESQSAPPADGNTDARGQLPVKSNLGGSSSSGANGANHLIGQEQELVPPFEAKDLEGQGIGEWQDNPRHVLSPPPRTASARSPPRGEALA